MVTLAFVFPSWRPPPDDQVARASQPCPPVSLRAPRHGQDRYSLAPASDLAVRSQVAFEMSWAPI